MEVETERAADANFDRPLIGSSPDVSSPSPELISILQGALANRRRIAAICIGAFTLGEAGLLVGPSFLVIRVLLKPEPALCRFSNIR